MGSLSLLQGNLPNPGIKTRSLTLQVDSLPAEPQGKSKNTGVGSLSFLQWIFLKHSLSLTFPLSNFPSTDPTSLLLSYKSAPFFIFRMESNSTQRSLFTNCNNLIKFCFYHFNYN